MPIVEIPGYDIRYGSDRARTIGRLTVSIPKILIRINQENRWFRRFLAEEKPDIVISDNRYGLHAPGVFSVFMTHQLRIRTPFGRRADDWLQKIHYRAIGAFSRCWIPDTEGSASLAGALSHPAELPSIPTRYIGWLSRFPAGTPGSPRPQFPFLLVLLSGPEPQRTLLEIKIIDQAATCPIPVTLVRGLPAAPATSTPQQPSANLTIYDHLPAVELAALIDSAEWVISRAGYSTVMDLAQMKKKAIFIPTPGQTEQEYLAAWLSDQRLALCLSQSDLSLPAALEAARNYPWAAWTEPPDAHLLEKDIKEMLNIYKDQSAPDLG